ncbi:PAS domain-containing sensor histidine kinase [Roseospira goensis]|uniref:histidine kinase n=1 Tax=Roseospira goensis TaxID=391922 RepID=A0A7W6S3B2_9PROT|nr:PAS domain-containing sensor histidine kinase [Roseospira goensis]MBB4287394.1 hypothetical protein [Roseospira goensis]
MTTETTQLQESGSYGGSHWLRDELFERIRQDPTIIRFLDAGATDGLWYRALDPEGAEWLSPRFKALFGYADDEVENATAWWQARIHPDDLVVVRENFEKHKADPAHPFDQVVRYRHRDGHTVWVRCRGQIIRDAEGHPVRMLGSHTDVTALKQAEADLESHAQEMAAQILALQDQERRLERQTRDMAVMAQSVEEARAHLEELNTQKDKFFSIVAHDLKSPFNPLMGFSELLATEGASLPPARVAEYGALLHRAATEAFKLLEDLLDWSRIQLDRVTYAPEAVDLAALLDDNVARYHYAAQAKGVALRTDAAPGVRAWADPHMLNTVVRNLLSNAIKFTRPGDSILVTAGPAPTGRATVAIRDTGVGIPAAKIPTLFDLGARASATGTQGETGTGMGLVISKELMDRQHGTIRVDSTEGHGTTFRLDLPAA